MVRLRIDEMILKDISNLSNFRTIHKYEFSVVSI